MATKSQSNGDDYGTFAAWLTASRKRARYSIRELALEAGVSHTYIARLETGHAPPAALKPRPSHDVVAKIAGVLNADPRVALRLAGWLPDNDGDARNGITDDERRWIARYRALSPQRQRLIDQMLRELDDAGDKSVKSEGITAIADSPPDGETI